jgi:hypothetical protein
MTKPAMTFATGGSGRRGRRWAVVALACLVLAAGQAHAVDDVVVADAAAQPAAGGQNVGVWMNNQNNLSVVDQWLFQRDQTTVKRLAWESTLARQLAELNHCCDLSEVQTQKMAMAMRCDVEHFFAHVDELRERFPKADQANMQEAQSAMFPLQMKAQTGDLCGSESFFEKMLPRVLDDKQLVKYREIVDQRRRQRYLAAIDAGLLDVEDRVSLTSRQHDAIQRLLAEQSLPRAVPTGWYMTTLIMYRLSQLPQDQLKPLFNESHWDAFNQDRMRFQGYGQYLQQIGVLRP